MRKFIIIMALFFTTSALAEPQTLPPSNAPVVVNPAVHRTYSVDDRVFVVVKDSQGNFILTRYEITTNNSGEDFIIKPILIIQTSGSK